VTHYGSEEWLMMMLRCVTGFGFIALLAFPVRTDAQSKELIARGESVYTTQKCSLCHSVAGKGQAKGPLDDVGGKLKTEDIREWIVNPAKMAKDHNATRKPVMKAYSNLPREDLDALVAYLSSLKTK
jgi:mono/diheme cytochrome c family protein